MADFLFCGDSIFWTWNHAGVVDVGIRDEEGAAA